MIVFQDISKTLNTYILIGDILLINYHTTYHHCVQRERKRQRSSLHWMKIQSKQLQVSFLSFMAIKEITNYIFALYDQKDNRKFHSCPL